MGPVDSPTPVHPVAWGPRASPGPGDASSDSVTGHAQGPPCTCRAEQDRQPWSLGKCRATCGIFFFPNELTTVSVLEDHHVSAVASCGSMHTHAFTTRFSPAHISARTPCVCLLCHLIMKLPAVNRKTGGAGQTLESGDCSLGASSHM